MPKFGDNESTHVGTPKRPTILLLITNLDFGGAQRVFSYLSDILSEHFDVVECVFNTENIVAFPGKLQLIDMKVKSGKNVVDKIFRFFQRVVRLKKIKRDYKIDVCISHMEGADMVNVLSGGRALNISWVHGSKRFDENIKGIIGSIRQKMIIPYIYSRSDLVVTVSDAIRQELIDHYSISPSGIKTMYNFFDTKSIKKRSSLPVIEEFEKVFQQKRVLLFSGRLAAQKNLRELLTWFSAFQYDNCVLVILGDGEQREELLKVCKTLGVSTYDPWGNMLISNDYKIYFLGFQENPYAFVKKADIFVLPSLWEGFPMALGEAMACGVPVATADCPTGPREMLCEKRPGENLKFPFYADYGVLLPILNKESYDCWSEGISKLLSDKPLLKYYSGQSLYRSDFFELEKNSKHVVDLVKNLIDEKTH